MTDLPTVKLKTLVSFPATVIDGAGVDVIKEGSTYRFDIAFGDFSPPVSGLSDPANQVALVWNIVTGSYVLAPVTLFGVGGTVPEAPPDGRQYGRQMGDWTEIVHSDTGGGGTPSDLPPLMDSGATGVAGIATPYSREDHVHPSDTTKADASHTHQPSDITDLDEYIDDRVAGPTGLIKAGTNVGMVYDDVLNTLTINATGGEGGGNVSGPETATTNHVALFADSTGKIIKDGGALTGGGDVTAAVNFGNDNRLIRSDNVNKGVQASGILLSDTEVLSPAVNDVGTLGSITLGWSDLHLAAGGVINWANGQITFTATDANTLTFAGGVFVVPTGGLQVGASVPFADAAGVLTLQGVDALDTVTEATIEAAIDTLANLTNIQGIPVTFADAGVDVLSGWDESVGQHKNFPLADIQTESAPAAGDFILMYDSDGIFRRTDFANLPGGNSITVASEVADTTCFPAFFIAETGNLQPKTSPSLKFDAATGAFGAATFEVENTDTTLSRHAAGGILLVEGKQVATLSEDQTWTGIQGYDEKGMSGYSGSDLTWNVDAEPCATVSLIAGNTNMQAPAGVVAGRVYTIRMVMHSTGSVVTWNGNFDFSGGIAPTLSAANKVDRFSFMGRTGGILEEIGRSQAIA
jgi:hypothetical protein